MSLWWFLPSTHSEPGDPSGEAGQLWLPEGWGLDGEQHLHRWPSEQKRAFTKPQDIVWKLQEQHIIVWQIDWLTWAHKTLPWLALKGNTGTLLPPGKRISHGFSPWHGTISALCWEHKVFYVQDKTHFQVNAYLHCQMSLEIRFILQFAKIPHLPGLSQALF